MGRPIQSAKELRTGTIVYYVDSVGTKRYGNINYVESHLGSVKLWAHWGLDLKEVKSYRHFLGDFSLGYMFMDQCFIEEKLPRRSLPDWF